MPREARIPPSLDHPPMLLLSISGLELLVRPLLYQVPWPRVILGRRRPHWFCQNNVLRGVLGSTSHRHIVASTFQCPCESLFSEPFVNAPKLPCVSHCLCCIATGKKGSQYNDLKSWRPGETPLFIKSLGQAHVYGRCRSHWLCCLADVNNVLRGV